MTTQSEWVLYLQYLLQALVGFALGAGIMVVAIAHRQRAWPYILVILSIYTGLLFVTNGIVVLRRWLLVACMAFVIYSLLVAARHYQQCTYNKEKR
jgi:hypothetical protein